MPVLFLERVPLPSLRQYVLATLLLVSGSLLYAYIEVRDDQTDKATGEMTWREFVNLTSQMTEAMMKESICVWILINMAYCSLLLVGKGIQNIVFGDLRVSEQEHIKDKFWNFLFYKFIFIFGVMNVENLHEVFLWCAWFSIIGFLHLLCQLCKDRFEYLSFSPSTSNVIHAKVLSLLGFILVSSVFLQAFCVMFGIHAGLNTFAFMGAECVLLFIRTIYVILRYCIHLYDLNHEMVWEKRSVFVYYTEFICEMAVLLVDFGHHLHMLLWSNIFLSMASLVIVMQLRYLFNGINLRIKRHKNYTHIVNTMKTRFPMATSEEILENSDKCAICWDKMDAARKLPCGHLFHDLCLRSWMEQDTSCPTCRESLVETQRTVNQNVAANNRQGDGDAPPPPNVQTRNHFFHFDGSRYVSWFPSFSVEVTHTDILGPAGEPGQTAAPTSQLDRMAREVQSVFQNMPLNVILTDLRHTRSVELTIENILEERLVAPPTNLSLPNMDGLNTDNDRTPIEETPQPLQTSSTANSAANSLNFYIDENIPAFNTDDDDESSVDSFYEVPSGGRFSKNSSERESILDTRKNALIEHARRKYLEKQLNSNNEHSVTEHNTYDSDQSDAFIDSPLSESPTHRRELIYRATQRRLQLNND